MMTDDMALVREYAIRQSEPAFTALVERHLGLVHSAALRQVGDPHLAEEIAQTVFIVLARKAVSLGPDTILPAWLYRTTRYAAADALKSQRRRQRREQEAYMQNTLNEPDASAWTRVAPLLDDAMAELGEQDQAALVLRYFENKPAREIAAVLKLTEDAAHKRVTRALDKLRAIFARRGATLTLTAIAGAVSANSVQAVPVGLAVKITAAATLAGTTIAATATATAVKTIAMTTLQKTLITAVVVASVATPLVVQHQAQGRLREQDETMRQRGNQLAELQGENERLNRLAQAKGQPLPDDQNLELLKLRGEVGRLRRDVQELSQPNANSPMSREEALASMKQMYLDKVNRLKQLFAANTAEAVPELKFLTDADWLTLISEDHHPDPDNRRAMSSARMKAQIQFAMTELVNALQRYGRKNKGQFPADLSQLKPYFKTPVDDSVLQSWTIRPASRLPNDMRMDGDWVITQKASVNPEVDQLVVVSLNGMRLGSGGTNEWAAVR